MQESPVSPDWEAVDAAPGGGPRSRNIHDTDEAVELASIVSGARVLARFVAGFFAAGAGEGSVR